MSSSLGFSGCLSAGFDEDADEDILVRDRLSVKTRSLRPRQWHDRENVTSGRH